MTASPPRLTVRPSAKELVCEHCREESTAGEWCAFSGKHLADRPHSLACDRLAAAIEARDREAEAREAGLRSELTEAVRLLRITHDQGISGCNACNFVASHSGAATPGGDERATKGGTR